MESQPAPTPRPPCRLFVILARDAPTALILPTVTPTQEATAQPEPTQPKPTPTALMQGILTAISGTPAA